MPDSIYAIVLTVFIFICALYTTRVLSTLYFIVLFMSPQLYWLAKKGWLPVTEHMRKRVEAAKLRELEKEKKIRELEEERRMMAQRDPQRSRRCCCAC
ncbi:unnamed protein product [Urochloa humidicola]